MKIAGIVAEYNPFHNGHKFHIDETRKQGATHIVSVMSPNFVQRGDVALFEKRTRTLAALKNGVDLILELPSPYALGNAETFAKTTDRFEKIVYNSEQDGEFLLTGSQAAEKLTAENFGFFCSILAEQMIKTGSVSDFLFICNTLENNISVKEISKLTKVNCEESARCFKTGMWVLNMII